METSVEISESFRWLDPVQLSDRLAVGDKAYYLSVLRQQGYPVVPGFVVTAPVLRQFLEGLDWLEPLFADLPNSSLHLNVENPRQLQAIAQQIRYSIQSTPLDPDWLAQLMTRVQSWDSPAVMLRPSLAVGPEGATLRGQQIRGFLSSQTCWGSPEALADALRTVWAELFRARSLFYWQRKRIRLQQLHLAVLIQPLWPMQMAGVMQANETAIEIQAVCGLGHGLVLGDVLPDRYRFPMQPDGVATQKIAPKPYAYRLRSPTHISAEPASPLVLEANAASHTAQPALSAEQQQMLHHLAQRSVADLGSALSLEWGWGGFPGQPSQFWLTQVNLETTRTTVDPPPAPIRDLEPLGVSLHPLHHLTGLAAAPGRVLSRVLLLTEVPPDLESVKHKILVVPQINPEWLPLLHQAQGLITEQGGVTSHGAILARELRLPAVVGVTHVLQDLQDGDVVLLDGDRGSITLLPASTPIPLPTEPPSLHSFQAATTATQLMVTLSQPDRLAAIAALPVDGLGLLRSEHLMVGMLEGQPLQHALHSPDPFADRLARQIQPFMAAFAPRPVFYRSADLRSQEYPTLHPSTHPATHNPLLGWHGPLDYLKDPTLFQLELRVLRQLQQEGYGNVRLLLPFVRTVEEFQTCFTWIQQAGLVQAPEFQVWIMAEVPAVLFQLPEFVQAGVRGITIGTNDLTQLLLAIDRDQPHLAHTYNPSHPAVMQAIRHLITTAKSLGIPCMLCGEAPSRYPDIIPELVRWGVTGLSVTADAVEEVHGAIARTEHQILLEAARHVLLTHPPD